MMTQVFIMEQEDGSKKISEYGPGQFFETGGEYFMSTGEVESYDDHGKVMVCWQFLSGFIPQRVSLRANAIARPLTASKVMFRRGAPGD